ncbi:MAG: zinc ABC transporter substrate-binding protein [Caldilineales bacterium]|nr:zinc ABC transporter substrate-binding protein [Caldilineales bacterium]
MHRSSSVLFLTTGFLVVLTLFLTGCSSAQPSGGTSVAGSEQADASMTLALPQLQPIALAGHPLKAVATTSIIGDVAAQVGGDAVEVTTLMGVGQDPHSYQPTAQAMAAVSQADVIFVNGWDLEEALIADLDAVRGEVPVVPISAGIIPLAFGGDAHEGEQAGSGRVVADPHVWLSISNVAQWVDNAEQTLSALDPANTATYAANASAYRQELQDLADFAKSELAQIPPEKRYLVTNHDSLAYFARDYDFEILGTVIPGVSTLAEPSAKEMANLVSVMGSHDICTLFTETSASETLAKTIAAELDGCDEVKIESLYTGSLGPSGSGADSYVGMFRADVDAIVTGLR